MSGYERHEMLGRLARTWHILPHNGTNAANTIAACGLETRFEELGFDAEGGERFVSRDRERGNFERELCAVCKDHPARARGLELWNR